MKHNKMAVFLRLSSIVVIFSAVIVLFSGCFKSKIREIKVTFPNNTWNRFAPMESKFDIDKTNKTYEVAVYLSVVDGFELDNVPLEIVITSPNGQENIINKTIVVKKDGNYLGKAHGDVWTTELIVYPAKQFAEEGTYTIFIQNRTQYYDLYKTESLAFVVRPGKKMKD